MQFLVRFGGINLDFLHSSAVVAQWGNIGILEKVLFTFYEKNSNFLTDIFIVHWKTKVKLHLSQLVFYYIYCEWWDAGVVMCLG